MDAQLIQSSRLVVDRRIGEEERVVKLNILWSSRVVWELSGLEDLTYSGKELHPDWLEAKGQGQGSGSASRWCRKQLPTLLSVNYRVAKNRWIPLTSFEMATQAVCFT